MRGVEIAEERGSLAEGRSDIGHFGLSWLRFAFAFPFLISNENFVAMSVVINGALAF